MQAGAPTGVRTICIGRVDSRGSLSFRERRHPIEKSRTHSHRHKHARRSVKLSLRARQEPEHLPEDRVIFLAWMQVMQECKHEDQAIERISTGSSSSRRTSSSSWGAGARPDSEGNIVLMSLMCHMLSCCREAKVCPGTKAREDRGGGGPGAGLERQKLSTSTISSCSSVYDTSPPSSLAWPCTLSRSPKRRPPGCLHCDFAPIAQRS